MDSAHNISKDINKNKKFNHLPVLISLLKTSSRRNQLNGTFNIINLGKVLLSSKKLTFFESSFRKQSSTWVSH